MKIGKVEIAAAARKSDKAAKELGSLELVVETMGIDFQGFHYIMDQRAMRAAMLLDGQDPTKMSQAVMTPVRLSERANRMMTVLTAAVIDGFMIGMYLHTRGHGVVQDVLNHGYPQEIEHCEYCTERAEFLGLCRQHARDFFRRTGD